MELNELKKALEETASKIQSDVKTLIGEASEKAKTETVRLEKELEDLRKSLTSVTEQLKSAQKATVPGLKDELSKKNFDFGCFVRGLYNEANRGSAEHNDAWREAGYEKEIIDQYAKVRANYAGDGTAGGYLIPPEVTKEVIDLAMAQMPVLSLGVRVIRGLCGDLPIPTRTSRTTAYMVGENEGPTASQVAYGEKKLTPHKVAAFSKQSNRLIYQSRGVSDRIIREDLAYSMKLKMEQQLIYGTGANKQVKGLLNHGSFTTSSVSLGNNGGRFRFDNAAQMITDLEKVDERCTGLLMNTVVKWGMKRERILQYSTQTQATAQPILGLNLLMTDANIADQLGIKLGSTSVVPANETTGTSTTTSSVIAGNWDMFWLGLWRDLAFKVSDVAGDGSTGSAFLDDQLYILALQEFDCLVMRESAFTKATGAETTEANW